MIGLTSKEWDEIEEACGDALMAEFEARYGPSSLADHEHSKKAEFVFASYLGVVTTGSRHDKIDGVFIPETETEIEIETETESQGPQDLMRLRQRQKMKSDVMSSVLRKVKNHRTAIHREGQVEGQAEQAGQADSPHARYSSAQLTQLTKTKNISGPK